MLVHHVYFSLNDNAPERCQELVNACNKYLTDHPGAIFFSAGTRTPDLSRDVNDCDFDVALSVVFESRAAHDIYQVAERHNQFIAEQKDNWRQVRVFDSDA